LSAFSLGLVAAGKLTYAPVVAPILYLAWEKRVRWRHLLLYALVAAVTMFVFNPTLWHHPVERLLDMLFFHANYARGRVVAASGYPWRQPLTWLSSSPAAEWHPQTFFYYGFDGLIFWLAVFGLRREWRVRRWLVAWIVAGVLVLLAWPTKWPQYTLAITPALCLAAGASLRDLYRWLRENEDRWDWIKPLTPRVSPFLWISIAAVLAGIFAWYVIDRADMAAGQRGWTQVAAPYYDLPGPAVAAIAELPAGRVLLGASDGLVVWTPPAAEGGPGAVEPFGRDAALCRRVTALLADEDGLVWCGTETGVVRVPPDGDAESYDAAALGLPSARVTALAEGPDGRVWAATEGGVARYIDGRWESLDGLGEVGPVTAIAVAEDAVWLGTQQGVVRLDHATGALNRFDRDFSRLASHAVSALAVDEAGTVWAATLGGGLSRWEGTRWQTYLTTNSDLPLNTVTALHAGRDALWVGVAFASQPGGLLARFDGTEWLTYFPVRTGYSGSEPLAITEADDGAIWVGTRTAGAHRYVEAAGK
jgi:ligand-binding sensor domain-containing protein